MSEAAPLADPRHRAAEGFGIERSADGEGEHQVGGVAPDASCLLLCVPTGLVDPQEVDERLGGVQRATAASGLEISQEDALPAVAKQLTPDSDERHWTVELKSSQEIPSNSPLRSPRARANT